MELNTIKPAEGSKKARRRVGRGPQTVGREVRRVGKAGGLTTDDADSGAPTPTRTHFFDLAVVVGR